MSAAHSKIVIRTTSECRCEAEHVESGHVIETDCPEEFGGGGTRFSSTDLLGVALGTCISTSLQSVARNNAIDASGLVLRVDKSVSEPPEKTPRFIIEIDFGFDLDESIVKKMLRAARACPVHRSLHPEIEVTLSIRAS